MKLSSDITLESKKRKVVTFQIEENDSLISLAYNLVSSFNEPNIVFTSPSGEHRLPASKCKDKEIINEIFTEIKVINFEIGEGKGACNYSFVIKPQAKDLVCYGPMDFDFYGYIKNSGIEFNI